MSNMYQRISRSKFYRFGDILGDYIVASLLWLILCIPVITFIPSSSALYYTLSKRKKSPSSVSKLFFASFKRNLKQGILINILFLIYSFIAFCCIFFGYYGIGDVKIPDMYFPFSFVTLIPLIFTVPFTIALLATYDNSFKATLINAFTLSALNLGKTLLLWLIMLLSLVILVVFPPAILGLPALAASFAVSICSKIFQVAEYVEDNRNESVSSENEGLNSDECEELLSEEDTIDTEEVDIDE